MNASNNHQQTSVELDEQTINRITADALQMVNKLKAPKNWMEERCDCCAKEYSLEEDSLRYHILTNHVNLTKNGYRKQDKKPHNESGTVFVARTHSIVNPVGRWTTKTKDVEQRLSEIAFRFANTFKDLSKDSFEFIRIRPYFSKEDQKKGCNCYEIQFELKDALLIRDSSKTQNKKIKKINHLPQKTQTNGILNQIKKRSTNSDDKSR